jgi:hypothetical protein
MRDFGYEYDFLKRLQNNFRDNLMSEDKIADLQRRLDEKLVDPKNLTLPQREALNLALSVEAELNPPSFAFIKLTIFVL